MAETPAAIRKRFKDMFKGNLRKDGYVIEKVITKGGGFRRLWGDRRYKLKQMVDLLWFAIDTHNISVHGR